MFNFPARERGASPSALSVNTKQRGAETLLNSLRAPIGLMCSGQQCTNEHLRGLPQGAFTSGRSLDWTDNDVYHGIYYIVPSGYCPTRKRETTAFVRQSTLTHKLSQRGLAQERAHELVRALLQGPPQLLGPTPGTELHGPEAVRGVGVRVRRMHLRHVRKRPVSVLVTDMSQSPRDQEGSE